MHKAKDFQRNGIWRKTQGIEEIDGENKNVDIWHWHPANGSQPIRWTTNHPPVTECRHESE